MWDEYWAKIIRLYTVAVGKAVRAMDKLHTDQAKADNTDLEVIWRDPETRSSAATSEALAKASHYLK